MKRDKLSHFKFYCNFNNYIIYILGLQQLVLVINVFKNITMQERKREGGGGGGRSVFTDCLLKLRVWSSLCSQCRTCMNLATGSANRGGGGGGVYRWSV